MLRRLAWSSILSPSLSTAHLKEIIALSHRNNERHHISGMLLFTGVHFLGILEGDEWDLGNLWLRLERDPRHYDLIRIGTELCGARWFPRWTMAYAQCDRVATQIETIRSPQTWIAAKWAELIRPIMVRADGI